MASSKPIDLSGLENPWEPQEKSVGFFGLGKKEEKGLDLSELENPYDGEAEPQSSNPVRRLVADPLVGLAKGAAVGIPETVVGLLDIPTMGHAGKVAETVSRGLGLGDFKSANEMFDNLLTPETREAQQKVAEAKGFLPTIATAIQNPSSIVQTVAESIPAMVTGMRVAGGIAKLAGKPLVEAGVANLPRIAKVGGMAEGAITVGQNIEQTRQQTEEGLLTPSQIAINTLSGVLTGMIGVAGGKLAQRFGLEDVDTLFTGGRSGIVGDEEKGIFKKILMGAFQEGVLEELPQSMQEQIAQNLALNKPIDDGVFEAGAMGMLAGFAQSTGANIAGSTMQKMKNELDPINQTIKKLVDETLPGELNAIGGWDNGKPAGTITPEPIATPPVAEPIVEQPIAEPIAPEPIVPEPIAPAPAAPENIPAPEQRVEAPAPQNIFSRMPDDQLKSMADNGVQGAKDERFKRNNFNVWLSEQTDADKLRQLRADHETEGNVVAAEQVAGRLEELGKLHRALPAPLSQTDAATVGVNEIRAGESSITNERINEVASNTTNIDKLIKLKNKYEKKGDKEKVAIIDNRISTLENIERQAPMRLEEITPLEQKMQPDEREIDDMTDEESTAKFRGQVKAKRNNTTREYSLWLQEQGVTLGDDVRNPQDGSVNHISMVTKDNNGFIQLTIQNHNLKNNTMSSRMVTVKSGDTITNAMDDRKAGTTRRQEADIDSGNMKKPAGQAGESVPDQALIEEARKYKTVEKFVNSQTHEVPKADGEKWYHVMGGTESAKDISSATALKNDFKGWFANKRGIWNGRSEKPIIEIRGKFNGQEMVKNEKGYSERVLDRESIPNDAIYYKNQADFDAGKGITIGELRQSHSIWNKAQEGKGTKSPITNQEQLKQRLAEGKRLAAEKRAEVASKPITPAKTNAATFGEYARELGYDFPVEVEKTAGYPTVKFKELNKKLLKKNNTSFEQLYAGFKASKTLSKEVSNETKTQTLLTKTKHGDIHPNDTWGGYDKNFNDTVRQTWKNKLEDFENERKRTIQENGDTKTSRDTSYRGENEVSLRRRLRDRRFLDEEMRGADQRNDKQRWQGVKISPTLADTTEFKLAEKHFADLGYQTVPITKVPWGMAVNSGTKVVFMGEMSGDRFAYFMAHETTHILSEQGNPSVQAIKNAVDLTNPAVAEQQKNYGWTDDYTRDEFAASIVGGITGSESVLKSNQDDNIKAAREATTGEANPTKTDISFGDLKPLDYISSYIPDSLSSWFKQTSTNSIPPSDISQANGTWETPASSTMNTLNYVLADRNIDLRDVTKSIEKTHGILTDQKNASLAETLFSGRLSSRIDDFVNNELHAVTKAMAKSGVSIAQIEEYVHARHAEEANNYLDSLPEDERKGDAGISTEDANAYLQSLDPALKEKYEKIALMLDKITHKNAQLLVDYGLESQETIDKWFSKYKHYVPLFREDIEERPGTGQGFTVAGSASKGRTGSERKVVHILSNIAMQRERTLTRGEKNRVSQSLVSLAENFPNEDFWKVIKIPRLSTFIAEGVEARIKPNVVVARVKDEKTGEIKHIGVQFNEKNERAVRMASALKNMDMDTMGEILGNLGKITRYVSAINTQYNPVFGVTNFFRDMGTAAFNLSTTPIAGKQKTVLSNVLPAMKGIWQAVQGNESSEMAKMFKDFQLHGGQTGYRNLFVVSEDRAKDIERELKSLQAGKPRRYLSAFAKILSDYNTMSENSIRLSAYKVGIESGMTKDQAASMAKNLTVNFNKKGQIAGQAGALYAFFNASVQGAVRMYETIKGPMGRKIIAGGIILGATQAMMLAAAGFKDEEPPEFVKERNIIIPIGGKKYITFPMPLGFNVIPNVGRILAEITLGGGKNAGVKMSNLIGMITETFNPMGSSGLSMQTVAPTFLDPFAALAENKDWTGRPIYKEDFNALNPTPGTSRVKDSATVFGRGLAWAFNILTGGDKYTPGMFSPTPDQIDYLGGQITGGLGREIGKTSMMFESLYTGNELPTYRLPLTGRFYGSAEGQANESSKYYSNLKKLNIHEENIKGRIKDREPVGEYIRDNPEAKLWRMANTIENTIRKIKKRKEIARTPEAKKTYDKLITIQQKRLNDMMERVGG